MASIDDIIKDVDSATIPGVLANTLKPDFATAKTGSLGHIPDEAAGGIQPGDDYVDMRNNFAHSYLGAMGLAEKTEKESGQHLKQMLGNEYDTFRRHFKAGEREEAYGIVKNAVLRHKRDIEFRDILDRYEELDGAGKEEFQKKLAKKIEEHVNGPVAAGATPLIQIDHMKLSGQQAVYRALNEMYQSKNVFEYLKA